MLCIVEDRIGTRELIGCDDHQRSDEPNAESVSIFGRYLLEIFDLYDPVDYVLRGRPVCHETVSLYLMYLMVGDVAL